MAKRKTAGGKKAGAVGATPAAPGATDTPTPAAPAVQGQTPKVETPKGADFSFAVNMVKLNRAKAYVQKLAPEAKGAEFSSLVRDRYIELGGLLVADKPIMGARRGKMSGQVVNAADNDGSKD